MIAYITVEQVDALLGPDWAEQDKKARAVMMANVWLTNRRLPDLHPYPDEWIQAGAEIAREAAAGRMFASKETGVTSKSVKADTVSSSKTYRDGATTYTAGESFALALLEPWLNSLGTQNQIALVRA